FVLGKDLTKNYLLGSILFPLFIKLTSNINRILIINDLEMLIISIIGGTLSGIGYGLLFKNNFTSGGTDILNQIAEKKFKIPMSKSMIYIDGAIVLLGGFIFGIEKMIYSIIALLLISNLSNKTMLEINKHKVFYIQTKKVKEVKKYLTQDLSYDVTIFESIGGYSNTKNELILCSVKTSDYYKVSTGLKLIDPDSFVTITENYEAMNENKMVPKKQS
ncbi:MAG: YitT family protein, partial [Bacilli bacterium]|nr:YitT family protein [Bacilli bacterium]